VHSTRYFAFSTSTLLTTSPASGALTFYVYDTFTLRLQIRYDTLPIIYT